MSFTILRKTCTKESAKDSGFRPQTKTPFNRHAHRKRRKSKSQVVRYEFDCISESSSFVSSIFGMSGMCCSASIRFGLEPAQSLLHVKPQFFVFSCLRLDEHLVYQLGHVGVCLSGDACAELREVVRHVGY